MSAYDLTTLGNAKAWLPIVSTNTNDDPTISRLITATSQDFMRATKRPDLLQASYTEVHQGDGSPRMIAFHWPITVITTLTIGGNAISESSNKIAPGWYLDQDIDPELTWNIYLNGFAFTDGAAVALAYEAGYMQPGAAVTPPEIALPEDIEQAVLDWMSYRYKNRPNVTTTQRRSSEGESAQTEIIDAPPNVLSVIERYTRERPSIDRRQEKRQEREARSPYAKQGKKR